MGVFLCMFEIFAFASLVALFGYREFNNSKERKDLLDRLMSRNFEQYTNLTEKPEENDIETYDTEVISLEEAREDLMSPGA